MELVRIEEVPRGEFFWPLRAGNPTNKVYVRGDFCRAEKKYIGEDFDDISRERLFKKGTLVAIGRTF